MFYYFFLVTQTKTQCTKDNCFYEIFIVIPSEHENQIMMPQKNYYEMNCYAI